MSARLLALLILAAPAAAQSVLTVGEGGEFSTPQAAVDAAAPGDIVLLLDTFQTNLVIDKGIALVASGQTLMQPAGGPGATLPILRITGVPAGQAVLISGLSVFMFGDGAPAAVEVSGCDGPVWMQDVFVDSYGAGSFVAHDAHSLVLAATTLQTNLMAALPDGTPKTAPGSQFSGATRAFVHDGHSLGSHGALQGPGLPVPDSAPHGGAGLIAIDAQVKVTGTIVSGGSGNTIFLGGCNLGGDGGPGLVTLDGPAAGLPAVVLRGAAVTGGSGAFSSGGCTPSGLPGPAFDVLPGSVTTQAALPRRLTLPGHVTAGLSVTLAFTGAPGDVALLFGAASAAPAASFGAIDLHLSPTSLFPVGVFALPSGVLNVAATVPALPPGLEGVVVPLQAVFVDAQGGKHASAPRALVIH